jgi:hypothetical protein
MMKIPYTGEWFVEELRCGHSIQRSGEGEGIR